MPKLTFVVLLLAAGASAQDATSESPCKPADGTRIGQTVHHASLVTLEWPEAEAGETSRVQLSTDPEFTKPHLVERPVPCCKVKLRNLEVGTYYWRVLVEPTERESCRSSFEVLAHDGA